MRINKDDFGKSLDKFNFSRVPMYYNREGVDIKLTPSFNDTIVRDCLSRTKTDLEFKLTDLAGTISFLKIITELEAFGAIRWSQCTKELKKLAYYSEQYEALTDLLDDIKND